MIVIKRDGKEVKFEWNKIALAIGKAYESIGKEFTGEIVSKIGSDINSNVLHRDGKTTVESIQDLVVYTLMDYDKEVAESYIKHRRDREMDRKKSHVRYNDVKRQLGNLVNAGERIRENSNSNTNYISTKRTECAKTLVKEIFQDDYIDEQTLKAIKDGYIYIHDLSDMLLPQYNCCLTNVGNILDGGFKMENVKYVEPKDIRTAVGQIGDIIMSISAQHFGGNTTAQIDKVLSKYYKMTIDRYVKRELDRHVIPKEEALKYAKEDAYRDLKQSLQGLEIKLNTVVSARGSFPFTTFSFGDVDNEYEADVAKAILEVRIEGHGEKGKKKSLIFPKLVFLHEELIHGDGCEYEWLFDKAVKCSSLNMYPDMIDSKYYKRGGKWVSPINN